MLSANRRIEDFIVQMQDKDFEEVVRLTDSEATEAERLAYNGSNQTAENAESLKTYAALLKDFMLFMRHGVKRSALRGIDVTGLDEARTHAPVH